MTIRRPGQIGEAPRYAEQASRGGARGVDQDDFAAGRSLAARRKLEEGGDGVVTGGEGRTADGGAGWAAGPGWDRQGLDRRRACLPTTRRIRRDRRDASSNSVPARDHPSIPMPEGPSLSSTVSRGVAVDDAELAIGIGEGKQVQARWEPRRWNGSDESGRGAHPLFRRHVRHAALVPPGRRSEIWRGTSAGHSRPPGQRSTSVAVPSGSRALSVCPDVAPTKRPRGDQIASL